MKGKYIGYYLGLGSLKSLKPNLQNRSSHHPPSKQMKNLEKWKDGSWWLLSRRGRVLSHLSAYHCRTGALFSKLKRSQMWLQAKNLVHLTFNYVRLPGINSKSPEWVTPYCGGWKHPSFNPASHLRMFAVWQLQGSRMLCRELLKLTWSSDSYSPCSYSMWAQMIRPGETWTISKRTTELWGC